MDVISWAARWGIPVEALRELVGVPVPATAPGVSETAISQQVRLEASRRGMRLLRNNIGACVDETGRHIRYGLANDSKQLNEKIKSGDLIGVRPRTITTLDLGKIVGQFVSYECKPSGWQFSGTGREQAQLNWAVLINGLGGDAKFITDPEGL